MGFRSAGYSTRCNVTSSVFSEKNLKNLEKCVFLESTCQVDQENIKKHLLR